MSQSHCNVCLSVRPSGTNLFESSPLSGLSQVSVSSPQELKLVDLFESSTVVSMPASVLAVPSRQKTAEIMYSITNKT